MYSYVLVFLQGILTRYSYKVFLQGILTKFRMLFSLKEKVLPAFFFAPYVSVYHLSMTCE